VVFAVAAKRGGEVAVQVIERYDLRVLRANDIRLALGCNSDLPRIEGLGEQKRIAHGLQKADDAGSTPATEVRLVAWPKKLSFLKRSSLDETDKQSLRRRDLLGRDRRIRFVNRGKSEVCFARAVEEGGQLRAQLSAHGAGRSLTPQRVLRGVAQQPFRWPKKRELIPDVFRRPGHWRPGEDHPAMRVGRKPSDGRCEYAGHGLYVVRLIENEQPRPTLEHRNDCRDFAPGSVITAEHKLTTMGRAQLLVSLSRSAADSNYVRLAIKTRGKFLFPWSEATERTDDHEAEVGHVAPDDHPVGQSDGCLARARH
jgi:hypothetical protein